MKIVYSDIELINGFRKRDEGAVKQLYSLHYRPLCYFADQLLHNQEEAEDIAIDSFLKLLNKKEEFGSLKEIKQFLFTTTKNACFDELRRKKRRNFDHQMISFLTDPEEQTGNRELIAAKVLQVIYAEVENLPQQTKLVFQAIFFDGKSTGEIAQEMGVSPQTVLNQKSRALQILRTKLYKDGLYSTGIFFYCLFLLSAQGRG